MKKLIIFSIFLSCLCAQQVGQASNAEEKEIVIEDKKPTPSHQPKPRVPAKKNVEAWLDGNVMTITFINPEGEAVLSLESSEGIVIDEFTYSTEAPIVVDLTPYEGVAGLTLTTESGHTYLGYIY